MSGYQPPAWAGVPVLSKNDSNDELAGAAASAWQLLEIKGGMQVGQHDLSQRACTLLGRAEDQVHISLPHESCSRLHARIAFDKSTGTPWLRDLGSAHGTTVNKKKLPAQACGRHESTTGTEKGSRGVILYPGDILQFGASTRLFCLEGPASFGRGAQQAVALQKKAMSSETPSLTAVERPVNEDKLKHTDKDGSFVSWGMDMEGSIRESDGTNIVEDALVREEIPQEHLKAFDTIQALRYKLTNLQKESNSIRRKGDLTAGQERQLERNEARETELQEKITEKEQELRRVLGKSSSSSSATEQEKLKSLFNVEEDVDDRTKDTQQNALMLGIEEVATEKSLTAEWKNACTRQVSIMNELDLAEKQANKVVDNLRLLQSKDDEDAFFLENELQLARDKCSKLQEEKCRLDELLAETERLLKVVNARLVVDRETGFIGTKLPKPDSKPWSSSAMAPPPARIGARTKDKDNAPAAVKESTSNVSTSGFMPPPKRKRVMGPTAMPPPTGKESSTPLVGSPPEEAVGPVADIASKSTLGVLSTGTLTGVGVQKKISPSEEFAKPLKRAGVSTTSEEVTQLGGKVDTWQAPKDQDGSGRSKLNEKFAGRY